MGLTRTISGPVNFRSTEQRLISDAKTGVRSAFDELMAIYHGDIKKFLSTRVDHADVDDLVQDVMVASWKALPMFDGKSKFRTWLIGICIHKVKDHYRARSRRFPETSIDNLGHYEPTVDASQHQAELVDAVRSMMTILSPAQAEVINLYYQQNLTLAEVASILDRNINTVKYQFVQAHARLHKTLKEGGHL